VTPPLDSGLITVWGRLVPGHKMLSRFSDNTTREYRAVPVFYSGCNCGRCSIAV